MRYVLKEKVLLEVLEEAVEQLRYTVTDIDNVTYNCLIREVKVALTIANKMGDARINDDIYPIGTYVSTVSGYWHTVNADTVARLVDELDLAVNQLKFPLNYL